MIYVPLLSRRTIAAHVIRRKLSYAGCMLAVAGLSMGAGIYSDSHHHVALSKVITTAPKVTHVALIDDSALKTAQTQTTAVVAPAIVDIEPVVQPSMIASPSGTKYAFNIKKGDTLLSVLMKSGVDEKTALENVEHVEKTFNPRDLKVGDNVELIFKPASYTPDEAEAQKTKLAALLIERKNQRKQVASWDLNTTYFWNDPEPYDSDDLTRTNDPLATGPIVLSSAINSSFIQSAQSAGLSKKHTQDVVNLLRYSLDFERDIKKGASFKVMFERIRNAQDKLVDGELQYVELQNAGKTLAFYRSERPDGRFGYFNTEGETNKRSLMRTPVTGARISSKFGMRHHPVLGYNKMHKGVDFAAPTGTPIVAAGSGVVEKAGRNGGYGKYVLIRHTGGYKTAYAHMNGYGKGVKPGKRVAQGDIIGYVGSTGRSTGPHLHFEVLHNNKQINPMTLKDFGSGRLTGKALKQFKKTRDQIAKIVNPSQQQASAQ